MWCFFLLASVLIAVAPRLTQSVFKPTTRPQIMPVAPPEHTGLSFAAASSSSTCQTIDQFRYCYALTLNVRKVIENQKDKQSMDKVLNTSVTASIAIAFHASSTIVARWTASNGRVAKHVFGKHGVSVYYY